MARPRSPAVVKWAAGAMLVGAAVIVWWGAWYTHVAVAEMDSPPPGYNTPQADMFSIPSWSGLAIGIVLLVAGPAAWLGMAWMALAGREGARGWSTVFFCLFLLFTWPYIASYVRVPVHLHADDVPVALELWFGTAVLVLLYRPAATQFFQAAKQARAVRRYRG